jgi:hypothetical protein
MNRLFLLLVIIFSFVIQPQMKGMDTLWTRKAYNNPISDVKFSINGDKIITKSDRIETSYVIPDIKVWDFIEKKLLKTIKPLNNNLSATDVAIDGRFTAYIYMPLSSSGVMRICVFDNILDSCVKMFDVPHWQGSGGLAWGCSYFPGELIKISNNNNFLIVGTYSECQRDRSNQKTGNLDIWDIRGEPQLNRLYSDQDSGGKVKNIYLSSNNTYFAVSSEYHFLVYYYDHTIDQYYSNRYMIYDSTGNQLFYFTYDPSNKAHVPIGIIDYTAFSNDNKQTFFVTSTGKILNFDINTRKIIDTLAISKYGFNAIEFSKDNKYLIACSNHDGIKLYHVQSKTVIDSAIFEGDNFDWRLAVSPDSLHFATGSSDGYIRVFGSQYLSDSLNSFFIADKPTGDGPLQVKFYDLSTGKPDSLIWDFGDGTTSSEQNPTHIYNLNRIIQKDKNNSLPSNTSSSFTVKLTVFKGDKSKTTIKENYIIINEPTAISDAQYRDMNISVMPNPFSYITTINYTLPQPSFVRLGIYDILGNEVAVPVNAFQEAGERQIKFDGSGFSPGMYFYRFQSEEKIFTGKLMIFK